MKNILAIIFVSVLLSACCTTGNFCEGTFNSAACGGEVEGYTYTAIAYGEGSLLVVPISPIRANTEWRFELVPSDLGGAMPPANTSIKIEGQDPAVLPAASGRDNTWIDTDGDYATAERDGKLRYLVQCTPDDLVHNDFHKYEVWVDGIGMLDPRGHVQ